MALIPPSENRGRQRKSSEVSQTPNLTPPPNRGEPPLGSTECVGLNHHLVNVVALRALKRAEVETHACRHDVRKHYVSIAFWAGTALDLNVDMAGQRTNFWHCVLPSKRRERNALSHRHAYWWGGDRTQLGPPNPGTLLRIDQRCELAKILPNETLQFTEGVADILTRLCIHQISKDCFRKTHNNSFQPSVFLFKGFKGNSCPCLVII